MDRADCHIQGGWFGGKASAIDWWHDETFKVTALQSGLQRFAGKEQDTWTHTARLKWEKVAVMNVSSHRDSLPSCRTGLITEYSLLGWNRCFRITGNVVQTLGSHTSTGRILQSVRSMSGMDRRYGRQI